MSASDYYSTTLREDKDWVRQAYFSRGKMKFEFNIRRKHFATAEIKFTDTSPGGNFGINPKPQFTEYCDIVKPGIAPASMTSGMGEYYSEAYDDNAQLLNLQFGVPEYNSLSGFFLKYYDTRMARLALHGNASGFLFEVGNAVGFLVTLPMQAIVGLYNTLTRLVNFIGGNPRAKFYYLKPTMPLYLNTVNTLAVRLGVDMGLVQGPNTDGLKGKSIKEIKDDQAKNQKGIKYSDGLSGEEAKAFNKLLPDVLTSDGGVDIYAMITRAQRLANRHHQILKQIGESTTSRESYTAEVMAYLDRKLDPPPQEDFMLKGDPKIPSILKYMNGYFKTGQIGKGVGSPDDLPASDKDAAIAYSNAPIEDATKRDVQKWDNVPDYLQAELNQGSHWVGFYVDAEQTVSESFSNSTKTSDMENTLNSASSQMRSKLFDFAHGNIGDDAISNLAEGAFAGVKSLMAGGLNSIGLGGLAGLGGTSYVDIPDFWESASASLNKTSYTMTLASPYGNKMSIYLDIYIPLCMLLAGTLPLSTGRNSYTSPFICRLHSTGRNKITTGIIDSLSITRGTGNMGWSVDKLPTSIDISFSIIDLNKTVHAPISPSGGIGDLFSLSMFDEDTALTDYLQSLGGLSLYDEYYTMSTLRLAWRKQMASFDRWLSPSQFSNQFAGSGPGNILSLVFSGMARGRSGQ